MAQKKQQQHNNDYRKAIKAQQELDLGGFTLI